MTKHTVRGIIPVETASTRMIEPSKPFVSIRFGNRSTLCICPPQPQSMITAGWTVVKVPGNKWFEWGSHHHRKVSSDSDREITVWIIMIGYYTKQVGNEHKGFINQRDRPCGDGQECMDITQLLCMVTSSTTTIEQRWTRNILHPLNMLRVNELFRTQRINLARAHSLQTVQSGRPGTARH